MGLFSPGKVHSNMDQFLMLYDKLLEFDIKKAVENIINSKPRKFDIGKVNDKYLTGFCNKANHSLNISTQ